ncbi:unnamed protein product [Cochlearia groenlandica]
MVATALMLVLAIVPAAVAVTYTVGDTNGWAARVNYTDWVNGKTFLVGDILEFKYGPTHTVDVVDKAGYEGCDSSSATEKHSDGDTKIELKTIGEKYYICPTRGHCANGQKLAVTVVAGTHGAPTAPANHGTPAAPTPPKANGNVASKGCRNRINGSRNL